MKITLIAVGTKMPAWVTTGFEEYQRRFPKDMPFELIEIPAGKRGKNADIKRILEQEGKAMLAACGKMMVVMCACLLAGRKAYPLSAKLRRNKAGHFLRSQCHIH